MYMRRDRPADDTKVVTRPGISAHEASGTNLATAFLPEVAMLLRPATLVLLTFLFLPGTGIASATPLGRSFTYQGQLSQSGVPVDGAVGSCRPDTRNAPGTRSTTPGGGCRAASTSCGSTRTAIEDFTR